MGKPQTKVCLLPAFFFEKHLKSLVIGQKGESLRNVQFSENLLCFVFLQPPF